jgi:hypothetical protein
MTAHGYQLRTATPAGDAKGAISHAVEWRTETDEANHTHIMLSQQQHTHHSKQKAVRGAGKSRRALSPRVSRGIERSIKRRVEHVERRSVHQRVGEQVGEVVEEGRGR